MKNVLLILIINLAASSMAFAVDSSKVDSVKAYQTLVKASCGLLEPETYKRYNIKSLNDMKKCKDAAKELSESPELPDAVLAILKFTSEVGVEVALKYAEASAPVDLEEQLGALAAGEFLKSLKK